MLEHVDIIIEREKHVLDKFPTVDSIFAVFPLQLQIICWHFNVFYDIYYITVFYYLCLKARLGNSHFWHFLGIPPHSSIDFMKLL